MFSLVSFCWFVALSAGLHKKTSKWISIKLGWRMGLSPEQTPFTYGLCPDKGIDLGFFSLLSFTLQDTAFNY